MSDNASTKGDNLNYRIWLPQTLPVSLPTVPAVPQYRRVLGEAIRVRRKQAGFSQEKLAEKADISPVYVSIVERGEQGISIDALMKITKALKVKLRDLVHDL